MGNFKVGDKVRLKGGTKVYEVIQELPSGLLCQARDETGKWAGMRVVYQPDELELLDNGRQTTASEDTINDHPSGRAEPPHDEAKAPNDAESQHQEGDVNSPKDGQTAGQSKKTDTGKGKKTPGAKARKQSKASAREAPVEFIAQLDGFVFKTVKDDTEEYVQRFVLPVQVAVDHVADHGAFNKVFDGNPVTTTIRSLLPSKHTLVFDANYTEFAQKTIRVDDSDCAVYRFKVVLTGAAISDAGALVEMCTHAKASVTMARKQLDLNI